MINEILNATTRQLGTTFGDTYHYYVENVQQRLKKPCFVVDVISPRIRSRSSILYDRTMPIVIYYFNDEDNKTPKADGYTMAEQIMECIEYLSVGNALLRAEDISWLMVDGVLEVFATYRFKTQKVMDEEPKLEEFEGSKISHI